MQPEKLKNGMEVNIASALAYLLTLISGAIFLAIEKDNKTVRFHAWQAVFLGGIYIAIRILSYIVVGLLGLTSLGILFSLLYFVLCVIIVYCMFKAFNNEKVVLPVIGPIAEQRD